MSFSPRSMFRYVSLARALSKLGVLSRSEATKAILAGRVSCNGKVKNNPEFRVDPKKDRFALDGKTLDPNPKRVYFMLNKPRGLVTTHKDEKGRATVFDCFPGMELHFFPVGRLDAESEGLLLFTNDSRFAEAVTNPVHQVPKIYEVELNKAPQDSEIRSLQEGITFPDGTKARPKSVRLLGERLIEVVLEEGKNREIRRICEAAGLEVLRLFRRQIGELKLGELESGKFRALKQEELSLALGGKPIQSRPRPQPGRRKK